MGARGSGNIFALLFLFVTAIAHAADPQTNSTTPTLDDLTAAERAIYELYLRDRPSYPTWYGPEHVARGSGEYGISEGLTPEAYAHLTRIFPELAQRVEAGRKLRFDYYQQRIDNAENILENNLGIAPDYAAKLRERFMAQVRALKKTQRANKIDPQIAANQAYETVQKKYQSMASPPPWDRQDHRDYQKLFDKNADQEGNKGFTFELPQQQFQQWLVSEYKYLKGQRDRIAKLNLNTKHEDHPYFEARLQHKLERLDGLLAVLPKINPKSGQGRLMSLLDELELNEQNDRNAVELKTVGPERTGPNPMEHPDRVWLIDLEWWGYSQSKPGKTDKTDDGSKERNYSYWFDRRQDRAVPIVDPLLHPNKYPTSVRSKSRSYAASAAAVLAMMGVPFTLPVMVSALPPPSHVQKADEGLSDSNRYAKNSTAPSNRGGDSGPFSKGSPDSHNKASPTKPAVDLNSKSSTPSENRASDNAPLVRIIPSEGGQLSELPLDFPIPYVDELPKEARPAVSSSEKSAFRLVTTTRFLTTGEGVMGLFSPRGFVPRGKVWIDGIPAQAGSDYEILPTDRGDFYVKVSGKPAVHNITYDLDYHPTAVVPVALTPQDFPAISPESLERIALAEDRHGITSLARGTRELKKNKGPVWVDALVASNRDNALYSLRPLGAGPRDPNDPLGQFKPYVNEDGTPCFSCNGSNDANKETVALAWSDHPEAKVQTQSLALRAPGSQVLTGDRFHKRLVATKTGEPGELILDGTPPKWDPQSPLPKGSPTGLGQTTENLGELVTGPPHTPSNESHFPWRNAGLALMDWLGNHNLYRTPRRTTLEPPPLGTEPLLDDGEIQAAARSEQAERTRNNRISQRQLRQLAARSGFVTSAVERNQLELSPSHEVPPYQVALGLEKLVRKYTSGELSLSQFHEGLKDLTLGEASEGTAEVQTALSRIPEIFRRRIVGMREYLKAKNQNPKANITAQDRANGIAIGEDVGRSTWGLVTYIANNQWTPKKSEQLNHIVAEMRSPSTEAIGASVSCDYALSEMGKVSIDLVRRQSI